MFFVVRLVKHHEASWSTSKYSEAYFASQLPSEFGGGSSRDFGLLQSWCFRAMRSPETQRIVQFRVRSVVWWVQCQRCDGKWTANMAEVFPQLWQPFDRWKEKKSQVIWLRPQFLTRWSVFEMRSSALKMQGRLGLVSSFNSSPSIPQQDFNIFKKIDGRSKLASAIMSSTLVQTPLSLTNRWFSSSTTSPPHRRAMIRKNHLERNKKRRRKQRKNAKQKTRRQKRTHKYPTWELRAIMSDVGLPHLRLSLINRMQVEVCQPILWLANLLAARLTMRLVANRFVCQRVGMPDTAQVI